MNQISTASWVRQLLCLGGVLAAVPGLAANYATPTKVNLFRKATASGDHAVQAAWYNMSSGGWESPAVNAIDAGGWCAQWNYSSAGADTNNSGALRLTLPAAVHVNQLKHQYGNHYPVQYRILASATGFDSLTERVAWKSAGSNGPFTDTIDDTVRYVQIEFSGSANSKYLLVKEVWAIPAAGASIDLTDGYNLFAQTAVAGGPGPITQSGGVWENPFGYIIDGSIDNYLIANNQDITSWFIIPLNASYSLVGAATGAYHGQGWDGLKLELTDDAVVDGNTVWTTVYNRTTFLSSVTIPFGTRRQARFVRVTVPGKTRPAMNELELFAVPTPPKGTTVMVR